MHPYLSHLTTADPSEPNTPSPTRHGDIGSSPANCKVRRHRPLLCTAARPRDADPSLPFPSRGAGRSKRAAGAGGDVSRQQAGGRSGTIEVQQRGLERVAAATCVQRQDPARRSVQAGPPPLYQTRGWQRRGPRARITA